MRAHTSAPPEPNNQGWTRYRQGDMSISCSSTAQIVQGHSGCYIKVNGGETVNVNGSSRPYVRPNGKSSSNRKHKGHKQRREISPPVESNANTNANVFMCIGSNNVYEIGHTTVINEYSEDSDGEDISSDSSDFADIDSDGSDFADIGSDDSDFAEISSDDGGYADSISLEDDSSDFADIDSDDSDSTDSIGLGTTDEEAIESSQRPCWLNHHDARADPKSTSNTSRSNSHAVPPGAGISDRNGASTASGGPQSTTVPQPGRNSFYMPGPKGFQFSLLTPPRTLFTMPGQEGFQLFLSTPSP
ncbi:hypothetical protein M413DRAFT_32463 [Hebeloma cylindrosporum]|uniref:Uncharacterized protein n=1 Tax=Hebeloma cylindrosporum TaxID=76867 RepID=A0A0C3BFG9_HEBCY|nr:hypothetical protein M413DRAFT_32463 [Hebeloma cylindrosporum h7]